MISATYLAVNAAVCSAHGGEQAFEVMQEAIESLLAEDVAPSAPGEPQQSWGDLQSFFGAVDVNAREAGYGDELPFPMP